MWLLRFSLALWALLLAFFPHPLWASGEFKKNNPDIGKYEFARSYISTLSYIKEMNDRWEKTPVAKVYAGGDLTMIHGFVAFLVKDNADMRIAKSYMEPYLKSQNLLIVKTADTFIAGCMTLIAINEKEKAIWDQWAIVKSQGIGTRANETAFLNTQQDLAFSRKKAHHMIIESSVLLTKVLRSDRNKDEKGRLLAITSKERIKLSKRLEGVGKDNLDWGLKPGQNYVQACVAVIREILEDTIYKTIDG